MLYLTPERFCLKIKSKLVISVSGCKKQGCRCGERTSLLPNKMSKKLKIVKRVDERLAVEKMMIKMMKTMIATLKTMLVTTMITRWLPGAPIIIPIVIYSIIILIIIINIIILSITIIILKKYYLSLLLLLLLLYYYYYYCDAPYIAQS